VWSANPARKLSILGVPAGESMWFRAFEFARTGLPALVAAAALSAACTACSSGTSSGSASNAGTTATNASPAGAAQANLPPGTEWAAWINRDIELALQDLPRAYTCDELWYRFHAILLAIGAREYMSIESYDCAKGGRSPRVDLKFFTLRQVTGDQIRWANTRAVEKTVVLAPGQPTRLEPDDCALVRQLKGTLFPYLDLPVTSARFDCSDPSAHDFELAARVLKQWPEKPSAQ